MRAQVKRRIDRLSDERLLDRGCLSLNGIEQASAEGVAVEVPLSRTVGKGQVCAERPGYPPGVVAWRKFRRAGTLLRGVDRQETKERRAGRRRRVKRSGQD